MKRRLVGYRVKFKYSWGERCWTVNDQWHRSDGGPACEYAATGYCTWIEHGIIMRIGY